MSDLGSLSSVGTRHARRRPARSALAVAAVALGVAAVFGVTVGTHSADQALRQAFGRTSAPDVVVAEPVGEHAAVLSPEVSAVVAGLPGVREASPVTLAPPGDQPAALEPIALQLVLDGGVEPQQWLEEHGRAVPGVTFKVNSDTSNTPLDLTRGLGAALQTASLLAMLLAGYLIFLTFSTAVVERRREYGIMRALGASRRNVIAVIATEAAWLGVVGTLIGLLVGLGLSVVVSRLVGGIGDVQPGRLALTGSAVATAAVLGILTPVAGALVPARRAASTEPAEALRRGPAPPSGRRWTAIAGGALLAVGGLGAVAGNRDDAGSLATLAVPMLMAGAILVIPPVLPSFAVWLRGAIARAFPRVGEIAVQHVAKERSRSAYTSGIVMIVLAMVVAFGAVDASWRPTFVAHIDSQFGADVAVHLPGEGGSQPLVDQLSAMADVVAMSAIYRGETEILEPPGGKEPLLAIDPASYFETSGLLWSGATSNREVAAALAAGGQAVIPTIYADELRLEPGDTIDLATRDGARAFTIAATYDTFSVGNGRSIVVGTDDGSAHFGLMRPSSLLLDVGESGDPTVVAEAATAAAAAAGVPVTIDTAAHVKAEALRRIYSIYALFLVVIGMTALVGILALANTVTVSVLTRFREIGVLRALGLDRRDIGRMVVAEALTLTAVGLMLAYLLGAALGALMVRSIATQFGAHIPLSFPWSWLPVAAVVALLVGVAAAIAPARRAARLDPVAALRFE